MGDLELTCHTIGNTTFLSARLPFPCSDCGAWPQVDGRGLPRVYQEGTPLALVVGEEPCPYTDEGAITRVTIPVPSGRLVMGDLLNMDLTLPPEVEKLDINASMNRVAWTLAWGELGVAWAHLGNTCPSLHRRPDGTLMVGWAPDSEGPGDGDVIPDPFGWIPPGWTELGNVSTDVWSYTMMDLEAYLAHGGKETTRWGGALTTVDMEPGDYEFTNFTHLRSFDSPPGGFHQQPDGSVVFTEVRRVG